VSDLRVVHEPAATDEAQKRRVLATTVEVADSVFSAGKGLMFRSDLPAEYALVMEVGDSPLPFVTQPPRRSVHMLFVRVPLDVLWLDGDEVTAVARMQPWRSIETARANRIIELPAGNATDVRPGDRVVVEKVLADESNHSRVARNTSTEP